MNNENKQISITGVIILILILINAVILKVAFIKNESWYYALAITVPLLVITIATQPPKKVSSE